MAKKVIGKTNEAKEAIEKKETKQKADTKKVEPIKKEVKKEEAVKEKEKVEVVTLEKNDEKPDLVVDEFSETTEDMIYMCIQKLKDSGELTEEIKKTISNMIGYKQEDKKLEIKEEKPKTFKSKGGFWTW